jgi:hypothetical protein
MIPELNLRSPGLLLGLCYRCLAGDSDPAEAPVTRRRLEDLKAEATELSLGLSRVRADLGIARDKSTAAARELEEARVDLKLFSERHPPPPGRRTLLGTRPGREDPEVRDRRQELERLAQLAAESDLQARQRVEGLAAQEVQLQDRLSVGQGDQTRIAARLRGQLVAAVLTACAAEDWTAAQTQIGNLRQSLRADVSIAVLGVLMNLHRHGAAGGRQAVLEASGLFENHPPQARRVVEALLAYVEGARMGRNELGLVLPGQLEWDGLYSLYQSIAALGGWLVEPAEAGDLAAATNDALAACWSKEPEDPAQTGDHRQRMLALAGSGDVVLRVICAHCALKAGRADAALTCSGIDFSYEPDDRRKPETPGLASQVQAIDFPAWPGPLRDEWRTVLCCQLLLAARDEVHPELFNYWLAESYGWPKGDFYWWVLAEVKQDEALLQNITGSGSDLVIVARI